MKDKFFNRFAIAVLGASLTALPALISGIETGTGTNQTANLYATNSITLRGSVITSWQGLTNSLDAFYIKNASNWSYYVAVSNVNLSDKELTNVAAMTLGGERRTTWPSSGSGGEPSNWSYYVAVSNVSLANKELTNVAAMTLSGERRTTWPSAGAGGDPTNWSYYVAVSNVNLVNKELTNVAAMTLGGERRTTWPDAIRFISKTADENVNNSTTLQPDDNLYFTMTASKTYVFEFRLLVNNGNNAGPDWKAAVSNSTASSALAVQSGSEPAGAVFLQSLSTDFATPTLLTNNVIVADGGRPFNVWIQGIIVDNGSAGTVRLYWAQNTATAVNLTVKKGSYVIVREVD